MPRESALLLCRHQKMASNKNQHFVPRCYLRPFTLDGTNAAINLYNVDRQKFIEQAPLKHQCSGDYFYGKDPVLEAEIQGFESNYAAVLREILNPKYVLTDEHRHFLKTFWLLQYLRTEAASKRAVEMAEATLTLSEVKDPSFRLEIREAVQMAMKVFTESMNSVADMKICLLRNTTNTPFITSDDPAILTNRWYLEKKKNRGDSFGIHSAGDIFLLPLNPKVLCIGYDGDVYSLPHEDGWLKVKHSSDVAAFNEHQLLNCRANIFIQDPILSKSINDAFLKITPLRIKKKHELRYAVLDRREGDSKYFRVVNRDDAGDHEEAIIHTQVVHANPTSWPRQIYWRPKGVVFTNDTGVGYVRRAWIIKDGAPPFRKEQA